MQFFNFHSHSKSWFSFWLFSLCSVQTVEMILRFSGKFLLKSILMWSWIYELLCVIGRLYKLLNSSLIQFTADQLWIMICNCVPFVLNLSQVTSLAQYTALNSPVTTNLSIIVWVSVLHILYQSIPSDSYTIVNPWRKSGSTFYWAQ